MKKTKKLIAMTLMVIVMLSCFPTTTRATVCGLWSWQFIVSVNDEIFEPWGYVTAVASMSYLCLHDLAYMLNGTSAQFNILTPIDGRWDFWIVRGEPYTPTGTEFQPIPERWVTRSDGGGLFGWENNGFDNYPEQTLIIGIDGVNEPATSLAIRTVRDVDNTYFDLRDMAPLLGFYSRATFDWHFGVLYGYEEGIEYIFTTELRLPALLPTHPPEYADILRRIAGHWVDREHFYSPTIDENIVWPTELSISYQGLNIPAFWSLAPFRPEWSISLWEWENLWWYPVSMRTLENGLVELTVNQPEQAHIWDYASYSYNQEEFLSLPSRFYNHRIIIDPSEEHIDSITLYIGDTPHIMRRYRFGWYSGARNHVQPAEGGGIMLRYILSRWTFDRPTDMEFRVYRSTFPIEQRGSVHYSSINFDDMELLFSQTGIAPYDRIVFEFIDRTVQFGEVYYYSLWSMYTGSDGRGGHWHNNATPSNTPSFGSIRVDVNEILGEPEPKPEAPPVATLDNTGMEILANAEPYALIYNAQDDTELSNFASRNWIWILALLIPFAAVLVFLIYRRFSAK